jgi:ABC-2 type transport system permease protein
MHLVGLVVAIGVVQFKYAEGDLLLSGSLLALFVGGLMLAQTIQRATEILDGQADLGWLLSSPVPPWRILTVRLISVACSVCIYWVLLLGPLANCLAFLGRPNVLAIYPMLAALGLITTSAGFALTFGLVRLAGTNRTRALANALATLIGVTVFLCGQARVILAPERSSALWIAWTPVGNAVPPGIFWWPARAMLGDARLIVAAVLLAVFAVSVVSLALERWFAAGALASIGSGVGLSDPAKTESTRFHAGQWANLLRKEILLLRRYPSLLGLALYYLIYLVPAAVVMWRGTPGHGFSPKDMSVAPVLTAGELARLFISACVLGDTVPDLAASAPVPRHAVRRAKLTAAALGVASILGLPVLLFGLKSPSLLPSILFGLVGVVGCNLLLGLWRPVPLRRADLKRDHRGWGGLVNVVGLLFSLSWSFAAWLSVGRSYWTLFWAGLAIGVLILTRPKHLDDARIG